MPFNHTFKTLLFILFGCWTKTAAERQKNKFSMEDLIISRFPTKLSSDIDMDPCKSGGFYGDIALPNVNYDLELHIKKNNRPQEDSIEKLRKEIFLEGLQIEEEGLLDIYKAKEKHDEKIKNEFLKNRKSQEIKENNKRSSSDSDKTKLKENYYSKNKSQSRNLTTIIKGKNVVAPPALKMLTRKKSSVLDDDFEQIEPKYFPWQDGFEHGEKYNTAEEEETDRKLKIQKERRRRIMHTGDPLKLELQEKQEVKNLSLEEMYLKSTENTDQQNVTEYEENVVKLKPELSEQSYPSDFITKANFFHTKRNGKSRETKNRKARNRQKENENLKMDNPRNCSMQKNGKRRLSKPNRKKKENDRLAAIPVVIMNDKKSDDNNTKSFFNNEIKIEENEKKQNTSNNIEKVMERGRKTKRKQRCNKETLTEDSKNLNPENDFQQTSSHNKVHTSSVHINNQNQSQRRATRAATARKERVWDYGVIPYEIDGNFSGGHKALFKQAMRHWENFTCVRFVERSQHEHPNYIVFTERPCGCCSFVGKRGNGPQAISIGKNCDKFGIVVHELGHVVGFWHEHTRPDRDNHVQIVRENIMGGQEYNFNKLNEDEVNSLGLPYDYDSIMHYARNTFSKGTYLDTIQPIEKPGINKRPEIGQRIRLSEGDIAQTNLVYKCYKCGRTFQENSGVFHSPNYGSNSSSNPNGEKCEWRITATHGEKIALNITDLDIYKTDGCRTDYLEVRDGYWHKSPSLAKICGKRKVPELIMSTGSRMLVTYVVTSKATSHRGFTAKYEAICGGEINLDNEVGHLESPNFPEDYQPNKECIWKLNAPDKFQIALKFQSFEVENHDNCVYDYVEVRDGHDEDSRVLGTYCGYKIPDDIRSTTNKLLVKFVSDGSVQKAGFSASFMIEFDECMYEYHGCEHKCVNTWGSYECQCKIGYELHSDGKHCEDACGGVLSTSNGTITSPSFPEIYPGNKKCVWEIVAPLQYKITLNFTHFDLEGNNIYQQECEYDKVEIHSKMPNDILRGHGVFCGSRIPPLITSESNMLRVEFTSDYTVQKSGFAAVFFTDMDECATNNGGCQHECQNTIGSYICACHNGFTLHENGHDCKEGGCKYHITIPNGQLQSPNFPDYYPSKKDCVWQLITTPGHRIKLIFNEFEIEPHQECAYDHIVLYDGDSPDAHTLGRFCGSKIPHNIIATGNQMYMVFKSDASVQRRGFLATHTTVCGGHLQATSRVKHFYSHAKYGDHNYDDRADCDWSIEAAPGRNVHLTFLTFEVEDETDCGYDFVEVFNGLDDSGTSYGRFCGSSNPTDIFSVTEALVVRFRTDDTINFKGFSAAYVAVDPKESV